MRRVFAFLIAAGLIGGGLPASRAAPEPATAQPEDAQPDQSRLDKLHAALKRERNERAAARIADQIRQEWLQSGSATIDLLMQRAADAMQAKRFDAALDFLDEVTVLAPDFAEGWNRRATVHFMMNNHAKSMADIEHTLRLEPRHFGALSGMAAIFKLYGNKQAALNAFQRVLDVYPMLRSAQEELATLADELAGEGI
jgi:tetratricopeptide (TPR) repeat protein